MKIDQQYVQVLIQKCINKTATTEERELLLHLFKYSEDEDLLIQLTEAFYLDKEILDPSDKIWSAIQQHIDVDDSKKTRFIFSKQWLKYAAVVLFLLLPLYFLQQDLLHQLPFGQIDKEQPVLVTHTDNLIFSNREMEVQLKLGNGDVMDLTEQDSNRVVVQEGNVTVIKTLDELKYVAHEGLENPSLIYHTVKVPYGRRISIRMIDGTKVALNSGTELRFPIQSSDKEMDIYLQGEGYFEVSKSKERRFNVHVKGNVKKSDYTVQVLGTKFNVKSFKGDVESKTTLTEGAIQILGVSHDPIALTPNQDFVLANGYRIQEADSEQSLSWLNNEFYFKEARLSEVTRELGRWYGVDFEYDKSLEDLQFYFNVSRKNSLKDILKMLNKNNKIKINHYGKKIEITKN